MESYKLQLSVQDGLDGANYEWELDASSVWYSLEVLCTLNCIEQALICIPLFSFRYIQLFLEIYLFSMVYSI